VQALLTLLDDPIAMGLLIASLAAIAGCYGMRWQDKTKGTRQRKTPPAA
jgi:hypothetical protein